LWKENINRIPAGWNITLSDLSSGMLDAAWRNLVVTVRAFQFREIDAQSIPFEDQTFDAVLANHMLYHIPDRPRAIAEIRRVLKPGGRLFATTIGTSHLKEIAGWIRQVSSGDLPQSFGESFSLENGLEQLQPFFSPVTLARYPDSLRVTEVEPVLAFMRSMTYASEMSEEKLAGLRLDLERQLQDTGAILIHKDSGLFEAIK
jgi:ubiquinone/menaquinone biosynthesis C-methylase UbiE